MKEHLANRIKERLLDTETAEEFDEGVDSNMDPEGVGEAIETLHAEHGLVTDVTEAQEDGFMAFINGLKEGDNPHNLDVLTEAWEVGYAAATDKFLTYQVLVAAKTLQDSATPEETDESLDFLMESLDNLGEDLLTEAHDLWGHVVESLDSSS